MNVSKGSIYVSFQVLIIDSNSICMYVDHIRYPQLKPCMRVLCVSNAWFFMSVASHWHTKLMTDTPVHAQTLFAHAVTPIHNFCTSVNTHTQFSLPMHEQEHALFARRIYRLLALFQFTKIPLLSSNGRFM